MSYILFTWIPGIISSLIIKPLARILGELMWFMPSAVRAHFASDPKRVLSFLLLMFIFVHALKFILSSLVNELNNMLSPNENNEEKLYLGKVYIALHWSAFMKEMKKWTKRNADIMTGYIVGVIGRIMNIPGSAENMKAETFTDDSYSEAGFWLYVLKEILKKITVPIFHLFVLIEFILALTATM